MRRGDTKSAAYVAAAGTWAETLLAGAPGGSEPGAQPPEGTELVDELAARFGLDAAARRTLDLTLGVETSLVATRRLREISGRERLTVAALGALLGDEAEGTLSPKAPLRRHGLIVTGGIPGGTPGPADLVALAPGMAARLAGMPLPADELGGGVDLVGPHGKPTLSEALQAVVREQLVDVEPGWVTMTGAHS